MLDLLETYSIHLFSILLLLVIYILNKLKKDTKTFSMKLFYMILFTNILLLIFEPLSFLTDKTGNIFVHFLNYALDFIIILFSTMITGFWASYIDYKLFRQQKRIYKRFFYQHATLVALVLLIINFFTPILFNVDIQTNVYQRGYLFGIRYLLIILVYLYVIVMMYMNRGRQNSKIVRGVLLFLLFPILGSFIQAFYGQLYYQFTGLAIGVLIVFVFLETTSGNKDYLTNLNTRRVLDEYIDNLVVNQYKFTIVMIDLDHFKDINDQYGHHKGDEVLIEFANILLNSKIEKQSLITRLGGDEFLCILTKSDHEHYPGFIDGVKKSIKQNALLKQYEKLDFSYGATPYENNLSIDEVLRKVDILMYEDKHKKS